MSLAEADVIRHGDENGNGMIARFRLSSGREIFGCATKNVYGGAWDVGPTWNYLVAGEKPFLVDSGRRGMGQPLLEMIATVGFGPGDLAGVVLSHGHEDHDGGLYQLISQTHIQVYAHKVYGLLNRVDRSMAPAQDKLDMPASCWHCPMPDWFAKELCPEYHSERSALTISPIECSQHPFGNRIQVIHAPGHCPDALTILVDNEAVLVGDTILPDISPFPTREQYFDLTRGMLAGHYLEAQQLYGLRSYLRSLTMLKNVAREQKRTVLLPGHRLFYRDEWNLLDLAARVDELFAHHIQRCSDILDLLANGPRAAEDIARKYFEPRLLEGFGINMAINEILSHLELMEITGDVEPVDNGRFAVTGNGKLESFVGELSRRPCA
jgi:glyoxylase-like metal-dependent hydrolase (beta-lactamase superfamily II)